MRISRRRVLWAAGAAAALPMLPRGAAAQSFPNRPIKWIVAFPPGGGNDVVARVIAPYLGEKLGQSIYIDSTMGHAYIAAKGCKEAVVLAVCSSADDSLLESLYSLHGDVEPQQPLTASAPAPKSRLIKAPAKSRKRAR